MIGRLIVFVVLLFLLGGSLGLASAHYTPGAGDQFAYDEAVVLSNGVGNYSQYTESSVTNGSLGVTAVLPNGTESAYFYNTNTYSNSQGSHESWISSGTFTFSAISFLYVRGTDNQTGYVNPSVWFFMNNSLTAGAVFYLLNSNMTVVATSYNYPLATLGTNVKAIFAEGNGSYERDDSYGVFNTDYNWKAYFDPTTGYIIGYVYTEQDSNGAGDGFTLTDNLGVTHTTYALTPGASSNSSSGSSGSTPSWELIVAVAVILLVVILVIAYAISRSRRSVPIPMHSATGAPSYAPAPPGPPPPGVHLSPTDQPAVQQIIIKETVKVNCRFCGSLIDSTAVNCPFCGAPRA